MNKPVGGWIKHPFFNAIKIPGFLHNAFKRKKRRAKILAFGAKTKIGLRKGDRKTLWHKGFEVAEWK